MMNVEKSAAILMPLPSLPGGHGIGDMGRLACWFIDRLAEAGVKYWQVLPLGIFDQYGCPYASPSAFGGEPLLISLERLDAPPLKAPEQENVIDFAKLRIQKGEHLRKFAHLECKKEETLKALDEFKENHFWAHDLCVFLAIRKNKGRDWSKWDSALLNFETAEKIVEKEYKKDYLIELYLQEAFAWQWSDLKKYAQSKNVQLIGDIPIFVASDSFDSWRWGKIFKRDQESGKPHVITGAPPDDFSENGQLWGTLNYEWQKENDALFDWWIKRLRYALTQFDLVRLDHFIGFHHVWESLAGSVNASMGKWVPSEGRKLFEVIKKEFPHMPFIAEDLGALSDEVRKLRDDFDLPSMRVFEFAINESEANEHLPQNVPENSFYYSGTHDNDTLKGWLDCNQDNKNFHATLAKRLGITTSNQINSNQLILKAMLFSKAKVIVFQLQDILEMGSEARINVPGTMTDNWVWRLEPSDWSEEKWKQFEALLKITKRVSR